MTATDLDLLREFARSNSEEAFAELVRRHLGLVHSAALRQVRSPQLAEEVAQSVFLDLARNANKMKPDTILPAWLYRVTRNTAVDTIRRESRRQSRETAAAQFAETQTAPPDWLRLEPLLDEAMETLAESDRSAILLRYFENKSLREVGETLGTSEDAAQKRVSRAVEQLRACLSRRDVAIGAVGLAGLLSTHAVQAAPPALAATIAGTTVSVLQHSGTIALAKTAAMTAIQKTLVTATVAAALGTSVYEFHQASQSQTALDALRQQQAPLAAQVGQLLAERDESSNRLQQARQEMERLHADLADLPRLRGEVTRLQNQSRELALLKAASAATGSDPALEATLKSWSARADQLRQQLDQMPARKIPEIQLCDQNDWLEAAKDAKLDNDADIRRSLRNLRSIAKGKFAALMESAFSKYADDHGGQLPNNPLELKPYAGTPVDDAVFARYKLLHTGKLSDLPPGSWLMTETAPVDSDYDSRLNIGAGAYSIPSTGIGEGTTYDQDTP